MSTLSVWQVESDVLAEDILVEKERSELITQILLFVGHFNYYCHYLALFF